MTMFAFIETSHWQVARTMLTERKKVGKLPSVMRQLTKEENENWAHWHQLRERMRSPAARHAWYHSLANPAPK
jgi:hypothetical protein